MSSDFNAFQPGGLQGGPQGGKTGALLLRDLLDVDHDAAAEDVRQLVRQLHQCGLTVSAPVLGVSDKVPAEALSGSVTGSALIRESEAALARLKEKCGDLVIIGIGYGAMLALEVARQNKATIQAVVMVEPRAWLPGLKLPFAERFRTNLRQAWVAEAKAKLRNAAHRAAAGFGAGEGSRHLARVVNVMSRSGRDAGLSPQMLVSAGQILDCLHVTLPEIKQPVLVVRRQNAGRDVVDSSILLQRRLGGRVESGVIEASGHAGSALGQHPEMIAERASRFIGAVIGELSSRRENEMRRQKTAAGRSTAA